MNSGAGEKNYLGQREGLGGGKSGAGDEVLGGLRGDERREEPNATAIDSKSSNRK